MSSSELRAPWDEPGRLERVRMQVRGSPMLKAFCLSPQGLRRGALPAAHAREPGIYYVDTSNAELMGAIATLTRMLWAWAPVSGFGPRGSIEYAVSRALRGQELATEAEVRAAMRAWLKLNAGGWVFIEGTEGTGKTTLAYAFLVAAACFGGSIAVLTPEDVSGLSYKDGTGGDGSAWEAKLAELRRARIVYLDDVGYSVRRQLLDWQTERWEAVIRLLADAGIATIATSNHGLRDDARSPLAEQIGGRAKQLIVERTAPRYEGDRRRFVFEWVSGRGGDHA